MSRYESLSDLYQIALSLLSDLQAAADHDPDPGNASEKFFQLLRMVYAIDKAAFSASDGESRFIWKERVAKLHDALMSVVVQCCQSTGQPADDGCVNLLNISVEAYEQLEHKCEDLSSQLTSEKVQNEELRRCLQQERSAKESLVKENYELRTRLHVQQQDLFQHDTQSRDAVQHLQALVKERDNLSLEKTKLAEECNQRIKMLERQAMAIAQLMDQCEKNSKDHDKAIDYTKVLDEERRLLQTNLQQHSKVIENLIYVNADLMEAVNNYSRLRAGKGQQDENTVV